MAGWANSSTIEQQRDAPPQVDLGPPPPPLDLPPYSIAAPDQPYDQSTAPPEIVDRQAFLRSLMAPPTISMDQNGPPQPFTPQQQTPATLDTLGTSVQPDFTNS